ncbi:unnamed protein product, partial [Meganyctiphanes norvegica]
FSDRTLSSPPTCPAAPTCPAPATCPEASTCPPPITCPDCPTTPILTTVEPTTPVLTTVEPTTPVLTTVEPTTPVLTTVEPTTPVLTTVEPTTPVLTTVEPTTPVLTTVEPTTPVLTTVGTTPPLQPAVKDRCTSNGGSYFTYDGVFYCRGGVASWNGARDWCENMGMTMAQPNDPNGLVRVINTYSWPGGDYWIGGKSSNTNVKWLNGTVISNNNPLWYGSPLRLDDNQCLTMLTYGGTRTLWTNFCTRSNGGYELCEGQTLLPNVPWHVVGSDRFVRFPQGMSWVAARSHCQSFDLDIYEPRNITAVGIYLDENFSDNWYWVGARGNGTHQVWLSGEVLTRADPWYRDYWQYVSSSYCVEIITHAGIPANRTSLAGVACTRTNNDVLCG